MVIKCKKKLLVTTMNDSKCQENEGKQFCIHSHQALSFLNVIRMSRMSEILVLSVCLLHNLFLLLQKKEEKDKCIKMTAESLQSTIVLDFENFISICERSQLLFLIYFQAHFTWILKELSLLSILPQSVNVIYQSIYIC